jgi:hypothetical protein
MTKSAKNTSACPASLVLLGSRRTRRGQLGQQVRPADLLQKRLVALDLRAGIRKKYWAGVSLKQCFFSKKSTAAHAQHTGDTPRDPAILKTQLI